MVPGEFLISANAALILWPTLAHIALVLSLYLVLTVLRVRAVRNGETQMGCFVLGREEPLHIARVTRNLANQFELPILYYFLVLLLIVLDRVTLFDIGAAWLFVFGRIIHTFVQTRTNNIPLRGLVFLINFAGVVMLVGHVFFMLIAVEGQ